MRGMWDQAAFETWLIRTAAYVIRRILDKIGREKSSGLEIINMWLA